MLEHGYFDHKSPYYGNPWDMATLYDYKFSSFGENIARYLSTPEEAMKAWMASDTHRENMLKPTYTHIGVAIKKDDNGKILLDSAIFKQIILHIIVGNITTILRSNNVIA